MNAAKTTAEDYIQFTIASPKTFSAAEAARVQVGKARPAAHDSFTRLLGRLEPDSTDLWYEVRPLIDPKKGMLVLDDSTLDKPYARFMPLVSSHWSGKHHRVVRGINLLTLLWTDGSCFYPCDYRLLHKTEDHQTKNDHFRELLVVAKERGFQPECVLFDTWYASLENFKQVRECGWTFLTRLKANRKVRLNYGKETAVSEVPLDATGTVVWLPGYGELKVFRIVATNGDTSYWASNDLALTPALQEEQAELAWSVEEYHRGLKQHTGVERCSMRLTRGQRNHIGLSLRAFVRLEYHRVTTGLSWFHAKAQILRQAIGTYLQNPLYQLPQPSTA